MLRHVLWVNMALIDRQSDDQGLGCIERVDLDCPVPAAWSADLMKMTTRESFTTQGCRICKLRCHRVWEFHHGSSASLRRIRTAWSLIYPAKYLAKCDPAYRRPLP
jgi:hypothetical protein